ncbi:lyase family protein [Glycomyces albidus]|uniref:3-carboxy-cis,cis-muconate cycloisomerase n=1 Tax=Glycomyces albidus TaxID=2656774 RepID=A0A6L5G7L0_9ACTN|nr:lyase family protein [Glycomyces albidus]MQM25601.1 3-carboxy-cis,cis-muconate cycloisomerase [Glycomyces albidus]
MSELFGTVFARGAAAVAVSDEAWLRAMLRAEASLAQAAADIGAVDGDAAAAVAGAADAGNFDLAAVAASAARTGDPVVGVVERLRALLPEAHRSVVHYGAASQDVLDTAMMLVAKEAARRIRAELRNCRLAAGALGAGFETEPRLWARTFLQRAEPIALGDLTAMWEQCLSSAETALEGLAFPVSLAGPVGTAWGRPGRRPPEAEAADSEYVESRPERALGLRERFASRLGLDVPPGSWHADRSPVVRIGAAAAEAAGACGKIAVDIVLLSQNEIGEAAEARGGSSISMPHKHNPVAATATRACAARTPGLLSTLYAAMPQELQRSPGLWHSEWETLSDLLRLTGSAATWLRESLEGLRIDPDAMQRNLDQGPT